MLRSRRMAEIPAALRYGSSRLRRKFGAASACSKKWQWLPWAQSHLAAMRRVVFTLNTLSRDGSAHLVDCSQSKADGHAKAPN